MTYANVVLQKGVIQETIENIDPSDTKIPAERIKLIDETTPNQSTASWDMNHEARADSKSTQANVLTNHTQKLVHALEI